VWDDCVGCDAFALAAPLAPGPPSLCPGGRVTVGGGAGCEGETGDAPMTMFLVLEHCAERIPIACRPFALC
jgi:hypothetical protein